MVRFLRMTYFNSPDTPPLTICVDEPSVKLASLEAMVEAILHDLPGSFFTYEIFEREDSNLIAGSVVAQNHALANEVAERNMAVGYYWYAKQLPRASGVIASTRVAPLTREQAAWMLRCIAHHPDYKGQRFIVPLEDGTTIEMRNGEVLPV